MRLLLAVLLALSLASGTHASDDCQAVMAQLTAAQQFANDVSGWVDYFEAAISAPSWDPVADAWMVPALDQTLDELVEALNAAAMAEERAHEAHCY